PKASRLFTTEIANGAPYLGRHWTKHQSATQNAVRLIQSWVDDGRIRPVDPLLFQMHIWAVTQHYADFEAQVRSMMELDKDEPLVFQRHVRAVLQQYAGFGARVPSIMELGKDEPLEL